MMTSCSVFGQANNNLSEFDNRYEGSTFELISGSADLQIISLTSYFQDFEWHKNQELKIRFHLDEKKSVNILAQQTNGNVIYRMRPKSISEKAGLNEFGPWPVDDVLTELELLRTNLGVTVSDSLDTVLYPAAIYYTEDSLSFQNYLFKFLPGRSLTRIKFLFYQGLYSDVDINEDKLIYTRDFMQRTKPGGEPFQLLIDKEELAIDDDYQGWITIKVNAKDYEDYADLQAIFFFYHSSDFIKQE